MIWNCEKCDQKWFSVIQNDRWQPFCEQKSCVLIWNGEKCDRKWFSVIQNGRWQPFCEKKSKLRIDLNGEKYDRKWFSVIQNDRRQPFCKKIKVEYLSEMARNAIEIHFRSSKMGASQWPSCKPFGDIHSICPWANTPIIVNCVIKYNWGFASADNSD